jgi:hypothetical protein
MIVDAFTNSLTSTQHTWFNFAGRPDISKPSAGPKPQFYHAISNPEFPPLQFMETMSVRWQ